MNTIKLGDQHIEIVFHFKKTKHSYVRVKTPGVIHVTVGKNATKKRMEQHIIEHQHTILQSVKKVAREEPYQIFGEHVVQVKTEQSTVVYDDQAKILYLPSVDTKEHVKQFEKRLLLKTVDEMLTEFKHTDFIDINNLKINTRYTKTVHGSCHAKKRRINLNLYLVRRNKTFLYYVLMHELAHLKVQNHSKAFYEVLRVLCPNYKEIKKAMKQH
mgnify:CR=1 FL=1